MTSILTSKVTSGHSALVEMDLIVDGVSHSIGQMGPDFLMLDKPFVAGPMKAEIVMSIDGREKRWPVYLPNGISPAKDRVRIDPVTS